MKFIVNILIINSFIFSQTNFEKGMKFYNARSEGANGIIAVDSKIDSAVYFFRKDNNDQLSSLMLLKSLYFKGEFVVQDFETKKNIFQEAKILGKELIDKYPDDPKIRYWYIVNLGSWGQNYGVLAAAREGVADQIKAHSEKIIELDPSCENGGGYFMLGVVNFRAPYIPFFLTWPDKKNALKLLEKAYNVGTATPVQIKFLSKALIYDGQSQKAKLLLTKLSNLIPDPKLLIEQKKEIFESRELLKQLN